MATITVHKDNRSFRVPDDKRLVRALEDNGIDILHRCGGYAKCTTCRVQFKDGEPDLMTEAEANRLADGNLLGEVRLSCQILCDHDMAVEPVMRFSESGLADPGPTPEDDITPDPVWLEKEQALAEYQRDPVSGD